jgi:hypothetical protein
MERAARVAALSNCAYVRYSLSCQISRTYQRQHVGGLVLDRMCELVVEHAYIAQVYFKLILLQKQVGSKLISSYVELDLFWSAV